MSELSGEVAESLSVGIGQRNAVSGELVVRVQPTKVNSAFNIAD
jgi:hypothetical protein